VPKSKLASISEYSFSFWTRWSYRDPLFVNPYYSRVAWTSLAGISEVGDWSGWT